ncbi:MAG: tetratricopeptide repeat protein [Gemmatimonadales bacterium]|jgi:tetratricopeptide (TPR) repeat protein
MDLITPDVYWTIVQMSQGLAFAAIVVSSIAVAAFLGRIGVERWSRIGAKSRVLKKVGLAVSVFLVMVAAGLGLSAHIKLRSERGKFAATVRFQGTLRMLSAAKEARAYRLEPDPGITAAEAGRALYSVYTAGERPRGAQRPPEHSFEQNWMTAEGATDREDERYLLVTDPARLFRAAVEGLNDEQRVYLREVSSHPGFAQYSIAARASEADILAAMYVLPFPDDYSVWSLPFPNFANTKDAARAHVALAALLLADGRLEDAETAIREVISVGLLIVDEGTTLIEGVVGTAIVKTGCDALAEFYMIAGREDEAETLYLISAIIEHGRDPIYAREFESFDEAREAYYEVLGHPDRARSARWGALTRVSEAPCFSVRELVVGTRRNHRRAMEQAGQYLLRRQSDVALFELISPNPGRPNYEMCSVVWPEGLVAEIVSPVAFGAAAVTAIAVVAFLLFVGLRWFSRRTDKPRVIKRAGLVAGVLSAIAVLLVVMPGWPVQRALGHRRLERALDRCLWERSVSDCRLVMSSDSSLRPGSWDAWFYSSLAFRFSRVGRYDDAADAAGEAVRLRPESSRYRWVQIDYLLRAKRFEEASTVCREWVRRKGHKPGGRISYLYLAVGLYGLGRLDEATEAYDTYLEASGRDPEDLESRRLLAVELRAFGLDAVADSVMAEAETS